MHLHGSDKEDEIRAIDWWRIILRRKYYLVGIWGLALLIAVGYLATAEPVYESKAYVQIGHIKDVGELEEAEGLRQRLEIETENNCSQGKYPCLNGVAITVKKNRSPLPMIIMTVHGHTQSDAERFIQQLLNSLISEHEGVYQSIITPIREQYESLQQRIQELETFKEQIPTYRNQGKNGDGLQEATLMLEKGKLGIEIWELKLTAENLRLALIEPESRPTKIIGVPLVSHSPIEPKYRMVLLLGNALGFVIGLFGVFLAEFATNMRNEMSEMKKSS